MLNATHQNKNHVNVISVVLLISIVFPQNLDGQELSFDSTHFYTSMTFDAKCIPFVSMRRSTGYIIDSRLFLLEYDSILEELEANKDQRRRLKKLADWHQDKLKSVSRLKDLGKRKEAKAEHEKAIEESDERLKEILLLHQLELLDNIKQRIYLRRLGVLEYLNRGDIGKQMKLKPHQIKKIESTVGELNTAWIKHKKRQSKQLTDKLLDVLDDQQQKELKAEFGQQFDQTDFEVHSVFLAILADSKPVASKKRSTEYLDAMTDAGQFTVQNDGSWVHQKAYEKLSEGCVCFLLMSNIRAEGFFKKQIFPESKIEEMKTLHRSISDENKRLASVRHREIRLGVSPEQARENQLKSMREDYARAKDWMDENLDEQDIEWITQEFRLRSMRCNGLLYELVGKTGKKLKLTKEQRDAIKTIATEEYDQFFKDSNRFESRLFSEIHKSLSGTQSKLLSPVTTWRPRKLCPSISLLLLDHRAWPQTRLNMAKGKVEMREPVTRTPRVTQ